MINRIRNKKNSLSLFVKQSFISFRKKNIRSFSPKLCKFLQTRQEVDKCTSFLRHYGFVSHNLICKDWDLAHIISEIDDGNFLDMGSSDSYILKNIALKRIKGELYGIDFRKPDVPVSGVKYIVGDLMDTKLTRNFFKNITCLSVIEHEVDFYKFAREVASLLQDQGKLYVTFDYWEPKINTDITLYGLKWQPLDQESVKQFVSQCEANNLYLVQDIDWTIEEAVIHKDFYSPGPSYTFGLLVF